MKHFKPQMKIDESRFINWLSDIIYLNLGLIFSKNSGDIYS